MHVGFWLRLEYRSCFIMRVTFQNVGPLSLWVSVPPSSLNSPKSAHCLPSTITVNRSRAEREILLFYDIFSGICFGGPPITSERRFSAGSCLRCADERWSTVEDARPAARWVGGVERGRWRFECDLLGVHRPSRWTAVEYARWRHLPASPVAATAPRLRRPPTSLHQRPVCMRHRCTMPASRLHVSAMWVAKTTIPLRFGCRSTAVRLLIGLRSQWRNPPAAVTPTYLFI